MEWIIATLVSLTYWIGFFIAYCRVFRPCDDSWRGWIKDVFVSVVWFITIPLKYFIKMYGINKEIEL